MKKKAIITAALIAFQLCASPFAMAEGIGDSVRLTTDTSMTAETQKLIDAKPQTTRRLEKLGRGLVAFKSGKSVMLTWRWLGTESASVKYNVYRNGEKLTPQPVSGTSFFDNNPTSGAKYSVSAVTDGNEGEKCAEVSVWETNSLRVPIQTPEGGKVQNEEYTYKPNDASVGDLDGDGEYEIVLKWDPTNSKDAATTGYTGPCIIDAYKLDGTLLWRINLGQNIRAGAHDTQFMVYDFNGDGKAEVMMKTADGTVAGDGKVIGSASKNWAMMNGGKNLTGPQFVTAFDGMTGAVIDSVEYDPQNADKLWEEFGDGYGNRSERYLASVAYLDGQTPSGVFCRGYYGGKEGSGNGRTVIAAYTLKDNKLEKVMRFDTKDAGDKYIGQGNHSMAVADVDFDGKDEIIYGALNVDDDGTPMYTTGLGHGDAQHTSDLIPSRPGLETFSVHESASAEYGVEMRDARTGELIFGLPCGYDVGRGAADDVDPKHAGAESWAGGYMYDAEGTIIAEKPSIAANFLAYWDGDLGREVQDSIYISKWNSEKNKTETIFRAADCVSINGTKANPSLTADLFGDWREEVMYPTKDGTALMIYTSDVPTGYKIPTLMHDSQYRTYVATQNVAYNQPPHLSWYLGYDTKAIPVPAVEIDGVTNPDLSKKEWTIADVSADRNVTLAIGQPKAAVDGAIVRIDNDDEKVSPYIADGGRTLVPLRFVSESFGAEVDWNADARAITIKTDSVEIKMTADKTDYTVNGASMQLDVPATITNDRTFVPLRAIAEALGKKVYWNNTGLIVIGDYEISMTDDEAKAKIAYIENALMPDKVEQLAIVPASKLYENQADVFGVTASGDDGNAAPGAVDGDMETRWSAYGPNWLQLDLGKEVEITGVAIAMWKGDEREYPFEIQVSADGENWMTALEKTSNSVKTSDAELYNFKQSVKAKYVKYVGDGATTEGKNYCHISEIVVLKK